MTQRARLLAEARERRLQGKFHTFMFVEIVAFLIWCAYVATF